MKKNLNVAAKCDYAPLQWYVKTGRRRTEVISLFMYRLGFFDLEAGRAAAVAVVMLMVNLTLAWVAGRLIMRESKDAAHGSRQPEAAAG